MTGHDLAHIVTHYLNQKGDSVSPKKLQKLLYYIEAWHLVHIGTPLIDEEFQAWVHGPVLPSLYHKLKEFGFNNLEVVAEELDSPDAEVDAIKKRNKLSEDQIELIYSVLDKYGGLSSFQLEMLSHKEAPWLEARGDAKPHESCRNIISKKRMKEFYSGLIAE
jgi:uncharacterized phage-associated protein